MPLLPETVIPRSRRRVVLAVGAVVFAGAAGLHALTSHPVAEPVARVLAIGLDASYLGREGVHMQRGELDCGVAVLHMVLAHHGHDTSLEGLRRTVDQRKAGLTLLEMQDVAARQGLAAAGWHLPPAALGSIPLPAVAHFQDHYVVLDEVALDGSVVVRDPALGRLKLSAASFAQRWTGNVLVFGGPAPNAGSLPDETLDGGAGLR